MPEVNEEVTRLFFEDRDFFVRANVNYPIKGEKGGGGNSDIDLLAINPHASGYEGDIPFVLNSESIGAIRCASIEVKGWHNLTITSSVISAYPRIFHFARPEAVAMASQVLGTDDFRKILVISALAKKDKPRSSAIESLRVGGIDHVLEFGEIMSHLFGRVEMQRHVSSEVLHTLRLMSLYT